MKKVFKKIMSVTLLCACYQVFALSTHAPELKALNPEMSHRLAAKVVSAVIDARAYDRHVMDVKFSQAAFKAFLESIDGSKLFFTQEDVDDWAPMADEFIDNIQKGRLTDGFDVFEYYRQKVIVRYDYVINRLKKPFNLKTQRVFLLDRDKAPWEPNDKALDRIWEDRLTNDYLRLKLNKKSDQKIRETLKKRYINTRNRLLRMTSEEVSELIVNAMTKTVDPHTKWMGPEASEQFRIDMSLSLQGVGIQIQNRGDYNVVRKVIKGGPAFKTGNFAIGDLIVSVGQGTEGPMQDVVGYRTNDLVKLIRGERGTIVRLGMRKATEGGEDGPLHIYQIVRDHIQQEEQRARSQVLDIKRHGKTYKIGYLTIPSFYAASFSDKGDEGQSLTKDVENILDDYEKAGVAGLVIDLRDNGGGSLHEVASLSGLFIGQHQIVVQVRDADGEIDNVYTPSRYFDTRSVWKKPIVLMINRYSASASEIFAGVMKDYQRGVVVGYTTWGKGSVQSFRELNHFLKNPRMADLGGFKWTIQMFFRPNGSSTQIRGVLPDIEFPSSIHADEYGEMDYDNALPWRQIPKGDYDVIGLPKSIALIKKAHNKRVSASETWSVFKAEKAFEYEYLDNKEVSLNEQKRLDRRQFMKEKREFFKKEYQRLGESSLKVFKLDDGLSYTEGDLKKQVEEEEALRDLIDIPAREAAEIVVDQLQ